MRFLAELFLIALLVWLGWDKSFHAWTNQWRGIQPPPAATVSSITTQSATATTAAAGPAAPRQPFVGYRRPQPANTPSGSWMWDPSHRGSLDRPAHDSKDASQDYKDAGSRNYWIDGNGVRHYNTTGAPPPPAATTAPSP